MSTDQTAAEAREHLRGMALSLATGTGPLVDPREFDAALDAYRDAELAAAAVSSLPADRAALRDRIAEAQQQPDTETLAALFEGFGLLLATSSRDWGQYAPDAWLYAVILGWDCEEPEHDETCTHGAMEEMQQRHGWSNEAVAKARRYRVAVRALTAPAVVAEQTAAADNGEEAGA